MKKLSLKIETKTFDIKVEDGFADFLGKDLKVLKRCTIKDLLTSYLQKSYELYSLEKKVDKFIENNSSNRTLHG